MFFPNLFYLRFLIFFQGLTAAVWPINPGRKTVLGLPCFPSLDKCPAVPDLVVIVTPAVTVPAIVSQCVDLRVKVVLDSFTLLFNLFFPRVSLLLALASRRLVQRAKLLKMRSVHTLNAVEITLVLLGQIASALCALLLT